MQSLYIFLRQCWITFLAAGLFASLFTTGAFAVDDMTCAAYAEIAVKQQIQNLKSNCGLTGSRWNEDFGYHAGWCANQTSTAKVEKENLIRANKLSQNCSTNPVCEKQYNIAIFLNTIHVHDEADGNGNAEPYLWPVFFKIDDKTITSLDDPLNHWLIAPGGSHENLGTNNGNGWDAGNTIQIPDSIGIWQTKLSTKMVKDQAVFGAIIVLLEEDDFPSSADIRNKHYPEFYSQISSELRQIVKDALLGSDNNANSSAESVEEKIQKQLVAQFKEDYGLFVDIFLPYLHLADLFINVDDFIGVLVLNKSVRTIDEIGALDEEFNRRWNEGTGSEDGDFELHGRLIAYPVCTKP